MKHVLRKELRGNSLCGIDLVGCGGTGSLVLSHLLSLHLALRSWEHPGLAVTVWDFDTVSAANIGRQRFYPCDIGLNKAMALVNRYRIFHGVDWQARPDRYSGSDSRILISCVDSRKSRKEIASRRWSSVVYHIDCGNAADFGQVLIGDGMTLPWPEKQLPDLFFGKDDDKDGPSCSLAEALEKQNLLVNHPAALFTAQLLESLLRGGGLDVMGCYYRMRPILTIAPIRIPEGAACGTSE